MSKKYKVHENFELEHLSWDDENCHCDSPGKNKNCEFKLLWSWQDNYQVESKIIYLLFYRKFDTDRNFN